MIKSQVGVEFAAKNPVSIEWGDAQDAYLNGKIHPPFNEAQVLHEIKHHLPAQSALKDFIHHNSLHAYQHLKFYEAIFKAAKIFGYQVTLQLEEFRQNMQKLGADWCPFVPLMYQRHVRAGLCGDSSSSPLMRGA